MSEIRGAAPGLDKVFGRPGGIPFGIAYYPEHWPKAVWADDFRRMREHGISFVRMAEFAWGLFEPEPGRFDFEWFDEALELAEKAGLKVVLGTPTASPPPWVTRLYPDALNRRQDRVPFAPGERRHYSYNSPAYRWLAERIVEAMAKRYGQHPAVVAWQIDNELNCEVNRFYGTGDDAAFQAWVRRRYGTLEAVNEAWGTRFWSQQKTDWADVQLGGVTPTGAQNPHQALDEIRFTSDSAVAFARQQAEILRRYSPGRLITTNGLFARLDYHELLQNGLDVLGYDSYPAFGLARFDSPLRDREQAWPLAVTRGLSPAFLIFEQQSGAGGWVNGLLQPTPAPGQMRLWTFQSLAHGAQAVSYFRWRTAPYGTEIYWRGLHEYAGEDSPRLVELRRTVDDVRRIEERLTQSRPVSRVGWLRDLDTEWDAEHDAWHGPLHSVSRLGWMTALARAHQTFDVVDVTHPDGTAVSPDHRLLIYPHPVLMDAARADRIGRWVAAGCTLIVGVMAGRKDLRGHRSASPPPGLLSALVGAKTADMTWVGPESVELAGPDLEGLAVGLILETYGDLASDVAVLATYRSGPYRGAPAMVTRPVGRGRVVMVGTPFSAELAARLLRLVDLPAVPITASERVEIVERRGADGSPFWMVLNYAGEPETIKVGMPAQDLVTGRSIAEEFVLDGFGVAALVPEL